MIFRYILAIVKVLLYEKILNQSYNYSTFCYDTYINNTNKINVLECFYTVAWNDELFAGKALCCENIYKTYTFLLIWINFRV